MSDIIYILIIISSIALNIYLFVMLSRALNRLELYEGWIYDVKETIANAYLLMKKADIMGAFEASDEVGQSFKALLHITNQLNNQINPEVSEEVINVEKSKLREDSTRIKRTSPKKGK